MSFAPHTNDTVLIELRAGLVPTPDPLILGCFENAETGAFFEYAERRWSSDFAPDFPHIIYVHSLGGSNRRLAKVLTTVAYIVVDEDADGEPVVEKWRIKKHRHYDTAWVR